jgi:hypothetical protein
MEFAAVVQHQWYCPAVSRFRYVRGGARCGVPNIIMIVSVHALNSVHALDSVTDTAQNAFPSSPGPENALYYP